MMNMQTTIILVLHWRNMDDELGVADKFENVVIIQTPKKLEMYPRQCILTGRHVGAKINDRSQYFPRRIIIRAEVVEATI